MSDGTVSNVASATIGFEAGGGLFQLDRLTIGIFLDDQPSHALALGSDTLHRKPLKAHQGWLMPPGAAGDCSFDAPLTARVVSVSTDLLREVGLQRPNDIAPQVGAFDPLILQLGLASNGWSAAPRLYRDTMERALAAHLAITFGPPPSGAGALDDPRLARAVGFIHDNLAADVSLEALASEAAMSPYHFARAFKAATGASPLQYVIAERMAVAKQLLATSRLPVADVAHRVGYGSTSRFGAHFKRAFGVTPSAVRS